LLQQLLDAVPGVALVSIAAVSKFRLSATNQERRAALAKRTLKFSWIDANCVLVELSAALIDHLERRTVFGTAPASVIETSSSDGSMPKPLLDFGDIGFVVERVGGGRGAQCVRAEAGHGDSSNLGVFLNHAVINAGMRKRPLGAATSGGIFDRPKEWTITVGIVAGCSQVVVDAVEGRSVSRNIPDFPALTEDAKVRHPPGEAAGL
jgi:hypothetical protein